MRHLKIEVKLLRIIIVVVFVFAWFFSGFPQIWKNPPIPPEIKQTRAASSVIGTVQGSTYSVSQEQVGGSDAHILVLTNPGSAANYKWQFLTNGLRFFIDRKQGAGWVQLVSQVQTFPQYIKKQGQNCVWNAYGLNINTTGGNVLQGFDRQNQGDGSVKMNRTYSTFEEGIAETLTETWAIPSSAEGLAGSGVKVSYSMSKNRGIVPDGSCQEGTWQMKWELSGIAGITADNSNMLGDDGKPLTQKYYSNSEFLISVLDFVVQAGDTVHSFSEVGTNNKAEITFFPSGTTGNRVIDPTVGTTSNIDAVFAGWTHNVTYANGNYWVFYYSGTDAVYASSSDGSTWSGTVTDIFSTANAPTGATAPASRWSVHHIPGTNRILAIWSDGVATPSGKVYFRRGALGSDGTITWDSTDITARSSADSPYFPTVSEDSAGYPYLAWRGSNAGDPIRPIEESKSSQTDGSSGWDTDDHEFLTLNNSTVRGGVLFDIGSQNMYGISVEGTTGEMVGNKFTNGSGWGTDSNIVTDTIHTTLDNKLIWSAVKDSDGNIHLVFIDNTSDIQHYKYTVSSASWALVNADVLTGTADKVTLAADGNNLYVFYADDAQTAEYIYYKKYNGSSWGAQSTLKADATVINGAISAYESSGNNEIGIVWVEEAGANDNVIFDKISLSTYNQSAYRFFNNTDTTDVGTVLANQDTAATLGSAGAAFRLRMLLHVAGAQLNTSEENFKLQFAAKSGGSCGDDESFSDVTSPTVIAYKNNTTPADGDVLTATSTDPTHSTDDIVAQTYEEANNFTNSVAAIPVGDDGKWDFALYDNGATASTTYCFRAVRASGTALNTYTVYPQITTASASTVSCSIDISSTSFGTLTDSAISTATSNASTTMSCSNTSAGCVLYVKDAGNGSISGLYKSVSPTYLISSADATLSVGVDGYGIQATSTAVGSGGTLSFNSKYNKTGNDVGGLALTNTVLASSTIDVAGREAVVTHKAAVSNQALSGSYSDTITYECAVN